MIDHPLTTERLIAKLNSALPIRARLTRELCSALQSKTSGATIADQATITGISYAGDEGGIICKLDLGPAVRNAAFASITHLRFDPRLMLAREITVYQKHRVRHLQRLNV